MNYLFQIIDIEIFIHLLCLTGFGTISTYSFFNKEVANFNFMKDNNAGIKDIKIYYFTNFKAQSKLIPIINSI